MLHQIWPFLMTCGGLSYITSLCTKSMYRCIVAHVRILFCIRFHLLFKHECVNIVSGRWSLLHQHQFHHYYQFCYSASFFNCRINVVIAWAVSCLYSNTQYGAQTGALWWQIELFIRQVLILRKNPRKPSHTFSVGK